MPNSSSDMVLAACVGPLFCIGPFLIPAFFIGFKLLYNSEDSFAKFAGLLTLKPLVTTPVFFLSGAVIKSLNLDPLGSLEHFVAALPAVSLTLLIAYSCRSVFSAPKSSCAMFLIVLDSVRWGNSYLTPLLIGDSPDNGALICWIAFVGLTMPTIFALVAWGCAAQKL